MLGMVIPGAKQFKKGRYKAMNNTILNVSVSKENDILCYDVTYLDKHNEHYTEHNVPDSMIHFINHHAKEQKLSFRYKDDTWTSIVYWNIDYCAAVEKATC